MSTTKHASKPLLKRFTTHIAVTTIGVILAMLTAVSYVAAWTMFYWIMIGLGGVAGVCFIRSHFFKPAKPKQIPVEPPDKQAAKAFLAKLLGQKMREGGRNKVVTNGKLNETIQKLLDLVIKDFMLNWYQQLGTDQDRFSQAFQDFIWQMVEEFTRRISEVDINDFITNNLVNVLTKHLTEIRVARKNCKSGVPGPKFILHPWLASNEMEMEFIRQVVEVFLIHLMPQHYVQCVNARHWCKETVACKIFQPCLDKISSPDYLNEKLLTLLKEHEKMKNDMENVCSENTTIDNYIQLIEQCDDVEKLQLIRYNIISQMLQTVANNNFSKSANDTPLKTFNKLKNGVKGSQVETLKQLSVAKCHCEGKIHSLDGTLYRSGGPQHGFKSHQGVEMLTFEAVMSDLGAQQHLMTYLTRSYEDELLRFWADVEKMNSCSTDLLAAQCETIYKTYLQPAYRQVKKHLSPALITDLEALNTEICDVGLLFRAQREIYTILERDHYPYFIHSDLFYRLVTSKHTSTIPDLLCHYGPDGGLQQCCMADLVHLSNLEEMVDNGIYTLQNILAGHLGDNRAQQIQSELEERIVEIQSLKEQKKLLELRVKYAKLWTGHRWRMDISNAEVMKDDGQMFMKFIAVVHKTGTVISADTVVRPDSWVVIRKLEDFHALHASLTQLGSRLPSTELPCISKCHIPDLALLTQAKHNMQQYIDEVLSDEDLTQTEAVFYFCSPSSDSVAHDISTLYNATDTPYINLDNCTQTDLNQDELPSGDIRNDCKAAALYKLLCEVFEQKHDKGTLLRLIEAISVFLHVTYGTTINSPLRETVDWLSNETVLVYVLERLITVFWPDGQYHNPHTDSDSTNKAYVKQTLLNNIPVTLRSVIGEPNCRQGISKTFEAFQDARLNKHLFYSVLQEFMLEVFPEMKAFQNLSTNEPNGTACHAT